MIHGNGRGSARVSKALGGSGGKGIRGLTRKGDPRPAAPAGRPTGETARSSCSASG